MSTAAARNQAYRAAMKDLHAGAQARVNEANRKAAREAEEAAKRAEANAKGPRKKALYDALTEAFYDCTSRPGLGTYAPAFESWAVTPEDKAAVERYRAAEAAYESCPLKD